MSILTKTNYDHLIDDLRLHLGDTDSTSYRYAEDWLRTALNMSLKALQRWWKSRYLLDTDNQAYRNIRSIFSETSPPVIENKDEIIIILMASIIIKGGSLESNAWNVGAWKDAEISYSNIQGGKMHEESIVRDWTQLLDLIKPPTKRLAKSVRASLPGYMKNEYDRILGNQ